MKPLNIAIATGISGLFAISLAAFDLKASAQAQPSTVRNTVTTLANLADGIYYFVDPRDDDRGPRRFEFRKSGNQVTGSFVKGPSGICIEGFIKGNIVTGIGLESASGPYRTPQAPDPRFQRSILQNWDSGDSRSSLKVGGQVVFNVPFKIPRNSKETQYIVWRKYRNIVLNINGYERRDDLHISSSLRKCQITSFNGKILSESELLKLQ